VVRGGEFGLPVVLKADGLAAGKGVVVAEDLETAAATLHAVMGDRRFGSAGDVLVIEECLRGPEVSFFAISDGVRAIPIGTAQDHKRIFDGDRGPNTGGMGAFAPSPLVEDAMRSCIMRDIVEPVISGMAAEGCRYQGFLYVGLMLTELGPKVIEFNVRLGDPEAQVLLPLIGEPLLPLLAAAAAGNLRQSEVRSADGCCTGIVLASRGYPDSSDSGRVIEGIAAAESIPDVTVYHAGTLQRGHSMVSAGGRVLTVVGCGSDYARSVVLAYAAALQISFDGMQFRHDIGRSAVAHQQSEQGMRGQCVGDAEP
jgi:phosphoribosylamine--glycine ligase